MFCVMGWSSHHLSHHRLQPPQYIKGGHLHPLFSSTTSVTRNCNLFKFIMAHTLFKAQRFDACAMPSSRGMLSSVQKIIHELLASKNMFSSQLLALLLPFVGIFGPEVRPSMFLLKAACRAREGIVCAPPTDKRIVKAAVRWGG